MALKQQPEVSEAERWRSQAEVALKKFSRVMDFFMFATAQLVKLSTVHSPDDFNHCTCCKVPWPCETILVVKGIGEAWTKAQSDVK